MLTALCRVVVLFWLNAWLGSPAWAANYWQEQPLPSIWQQYLQQSDQLRQLDKAQLAAEQQRLGAATILAANKAQHFGLEAITDAAAADAVMSFQTPSGGWSKRTDMRLPRQLGQHYGSEPHYVPTFDNDATTTQLFWLADFFPRAAAEQQAHIKLSIERAISLILQAQYPNGGFPQSYPLQGGYHDAITLNDNAMYLLLESLWQVSAHPNFDMVSSTLRAQAKDSFYRAVDWLLANQINVDGQLTVWAAQHHPLSGQPVIARRYEQIALVSSESAKILELLLRYAMDYPGVNTTVAAAANWLEQKKIVDKRHMRDQDGRLSLIDKPGNNVWARFYDIKTGFPVFFDRDGSIYDDVTQLSLERQRGYGWYQSNPETFLQLYQRLKQQNDN